MTQAPPQRPRPDLRRLPLAYLVAAAVAPILLLAATWWVVAGREPAFPTAIGQMAPTFSLTSLDGEEIRLADLRGRPVIVYFWASYCEPCREEVPLLERAAERHAADGLAIVGVVFEDGPDTARDFMARYGATWPSAMDPGAEVADAYRVFGPPETYFVDRDGRIAARQIGQISERSLTDKLAAIIDAP